MDYGVERAESAKAWFKPGPVGVISRSGGMSSSTAYYLGRASIGTSTICHVGGDSVIGLRFPDVALMFEDDPATEAIVLFGEIGGSMEEDLAALMKAGRVTIVDERFVEAAHQRGLQVHVWTIDEPDEMERLVDLGVDGIMTDRPTVLRQVLEERDLWA